ncbi:MAG TPA: hypothetical protein VFZ84_01370 [Burkholderiales bacterium]
MSHTRDKNEIRGAGELRASSATIGVASSAHQLIDAAEDFLAALEHLVEGTGSRLGRACPFMGAWALGCALKSHLSRRRLSDDDLKKYGHDLQELWRKAAEFDLPIPSEPPHWCVLLDSLHDWPYRLRYPSDCNGYISPVRKEMTAELRTLIALVKTATP